MRKHISDHERNEKDAQIARVVERAAKAVWLRHRVEECEPPEVTWEEHAIHTVHHQVYFDVVRSVLAALREPTAAMLDAGEEPFAEPFVGGRLTDPCKVWEAMIDAALQEPTP